MMSNMKFGMTKMPAIATDTANMLKPRVGGDWTEFGSTIIIWDIIIPIII